MSGSMMSTHWCCSLVGYGRRGQLRVHVTIAAHHVGKAAHTALALAGGQSTATHRRLTAMLAELQTLALSDEGKR